VTAFEDPEGGPGPALLAAVTVKVYAVPFASPVTVAEVPDVVALAPPGLAVTV
jgi:hypothetical protein